jgi:hypothetical protein
LSWLWAQSQASQGKGREKKGIFRMIINNKIDLKKAW